MPLDISADPVTGRAGTAARTTGAVAGIAAGTMAARLAARYAVGVARADRSWPAQVAPRLTNLGAVDEVSIRPLVERAVPPGGRLTGEAGVSYLIEAGHTRVLFDCGLSGGRQPSALARNAAELGVDLTKLDAVVVSHLHVDHVGGLRAARARTFAFSRGTTPTRGLPAYVPTAMSHPSAEIVETTAPRVIAPGMAVLPPQPRMLFWFGSIAEQALVVNVRKFGLVLISGCGHPRIERMLGIAERVLDVPIQAVVGGLHLPVHALGTPLVPQAVLGNPHWPWRPISERDVADVLAAIEDRGPRLVALSGHDSTPWTDRAFARHFGDRYRLLRVGESLRISA